ncbi:MAG TPA: nitroreductase family protein, partial [Candidatus Binatus sp.]|nr:nitroreductase family protein [Candidatus Binatus sp.]
RPVPADVKAKVLEAGRNSPTGMNTQHWRFILIQEPADVKKLAQDSTSGKWVAGANFAIIILTNPKYGFHLIDAGRAAQNLQISAWNYGVVSDLYTGVNAEALRKDFLVPSELNPTIVLGFGYPKRKITGKKKNRLPLSQVAFAERYGNPVDLKKLKG